ncbi:transglutaminase-like domain-containing protein [Aquimarina aggregata]|uniref:transglutaminase-like domain-containing protein n=1 Tax=Aquimarina aggregata TaxID=1642818 RepID=UPI0024901AB3|nr:transglutaminase domain-containing protein [Aquimarina aggregata]
MNYLTPTYYFDYETEEIQKLIKEYDTTELTEKEKAIKIYLKIRDDWRYDAYHINLSKKCFKASFIAKKSKGHCVDKSILLVACLRGLGIPARIHLAKVKNHIGIERLIQKFGTNELTPHGMVNVLLNDQWLKISPAFNKALCRKCNVAPLDFDGENDSIFQEYNNEGNVFMEYLDDYGHFNDVPFDFILENLNVHYPDIVKQFEGKKEIIL